MLMSFQIALSDVLHFSIKHDQARSCFQLWPKIGGEDDKISRKKLARRQFFFLKILYWAIIENMISPDHVLYSNVTHDLMQFGKT